MISIKYAQLHTPMFLAGTNLSDKLDPNKRGGLVLEYDRAEKELLVQYKKEMAIVPSTNIVSMIPKGPETVISPLKGFDQISPLHDADPVVFRHSNTAQVETPMSHVFEGAGAGKTGKSK